MKHRDYADSFTEKTLNESIDDMLTALIDRGYASKIEMLFPASKSLILLKKFSQLIIFFGIIRVLLLKRSILEAIIVAFAGILGLWLCGLLRGRELRNQIKKEENIRILLDLFRATILKENCPSNETTCAGR